jgi:hypothetical protein
MVNRRTDARERIPTENTDAQDRITTEETACWSSTGFRVKTERLPRLGRRSPVFYRCRFLAPKTNPCQLTLTRAS